MTPAGVLLCCLVLAAVPPLSDVERDRLATAVDDLDVVLDEPGPALVALLEHCRRWTGGAGDAPIRLEPDLDRLLEDPAAFRGELCRLRGRLQQRTPLPGRDGDAEWALRDDEGRPMLVYVANADASPLRDGTIVEIDARFLRRVRAVARDGEVRLYPAFVGARPRAGAAPAWPGPGPVVVPVVVMFLVFAALMLYARRSGRSSRRPRRPATPPERGGPPLPTDPVDALTELRRRAEVTER